MVMYEDRRLKYLHVREQFMGYDVETKPFEMQSDLFWNLAEPARGKSR
jgi:hypothetical protein